MAQPPLPPGFQLDTPSAPGPRVIPGTPRPIAPPSGYRPDGNGLAPIPGGPHDPNAPQPPPAGYRSNGAGGFEPIPGGPADPNRTQPPAGFRPTQGGNLEPIPGGPQDPNRPTGPNDITESERTAAFLTTRVQNGVNNLNRLIGSNPGAARPTAGAAIIGGIFGNEARNWANSPARQQVEAAQLDILDAALTLGTGAAYTREQLEGYRQSYFPMVTDSPEAVEFKRRQLIALLQAARVKAGRAAPGIDQAIALIEQQAPQNQDGPLGAAADAAFAMTANAAQTGGAPAGETPGPQQAQGLRLSPEQYDELIAFAQTRPTAEQLDAWFRERGFGGLGNAQDVAQSLQNGVLPSGVSYDRVDAAATQAPPPADTPDLASRLGAAASQGAVSLLGAPVDLVNGGLRALGLPMSDNPLGGSQSIADMISYIPNALMGTDVDIFSPRNAPQSGVEAFGQNALRFLGGGILPAGALYGRGANLLGGGGPGGGNALMQGVDRIAIETARRPGAVAASEVGASVGGAGGISGADAIDPNNTWLRTVLGTVGSIAGGGTSGMVASRGPRQPAHPAYAAAARQDMTGDLLAADVSQARGGVQRATSGTASTLGGSNTIARGADRLPASVEQRVTDLAQNAGTVRTREEMGFAAERGVRRMDRSLQREGGDAYSSGEARVPNPVAAPSAIQNIDQQLSKLDMDGVDDPVRDALQTLRRGLVDENGDPRPLSIESMRRFQSTVRGMARSDTLIRTDFERRAKEVVRALRQDFETQLSPEARRDFRQGDRTWRLRHGLSEEVATQLMGRGATASDERIATRLRNMVFSDSRNLNRLLRNAPREDAGNMRASIIDSLGRNAKGRFTVSDLVDNWDKMPGRSRNALFPDAADRQTIEDLVTMARSRQVSQQTTNFSQTTSAANASDGIRMVSTIGGWSTLGATTLAENLTARLLTSRRFLRWAAAGQRTNDPQRHIARLAGIASAEPAIAQDVLNLQGALSRAANDNALRGTAAAQSDQERQ